ncbi:MAG TPA: sigma-70 family RNA polymerase sigma factor, partial [Ktedonobacterales bacterium]
MLATPDMTEQFTAALTSERARLVRLCARLTGSSAAAEDLAQETLLEAWRALEKLRDASGISPWLSAIARNVCLRYQRRRGRELAHQLPGDAEAWMAAELLADDEPLSLAVEDAEV